MCCHLELASLTSYENRKAASINLKQAAFANRCCSFSLMLFWK
jgi:hypothetical protein